MQFWIRGITFSGLWADFARFFQYVDEIFLSIWTQSVSWLCEPWRWTIKFLISPSFAAFYSQDSEHILFLRYYKIALLSSICKSNSGCQSVLFGIRNDLCTKFKANVTWNCSVLISFAISNLLESVFFRIKRKIESNLVIISADRNREGFHINEGANKWRFIKYLYHTPEKCINNKYNFQNNINNGMISPINHYSKSREI